MNQKNKAVIIIISILLLFSLLCILFFSNENGVEDPSSNNENLYENNGSDDDLNEDENTDLEEISYIEFSDITNYGRYFSLSSTVKSIYLNMYLNNYDELIDTLNPYYINLNKVDSKNIGNYLYFTDEYYNASIVDFKEVYIYEDVAITYLKIKLKQDALNTAYSLLDIYYEYIAIFYDEETSCYSFMPIDEDEFNKTEVLSTESSLLVESISSNENNGYSNVSVTDSMIVDLYFYNFVSSFINEMEGYEDLIYGDLPEDYERYSSFSVSEYSYISATDSLTVIDAYGFTYEFYINNVLDYKVKIS